MLSSFLLISDNLIKSKTENKVSITFSIFDLIKLSLMSKNDDNIEHNHDLINEEINLDERI